MQSIDVKGIMMAHRSAVILGATIAGFGLAACQDGSNLHRDDSFIMDMEFGPATQANIAAQTGAPDIEDLAISFVRDVDPEVTFEFDRSVLDASARATLQVQADWIRSHPDARLRIYGHADQVGDADYNHALGQRRAETVMRYLMGLGVSRDRLEAVVSHGETRPVIDSGNRERRNRRAVTEVHGLVSDPEESLTLDGRYAREVYNAHVGGS